MKKKLFSVTLKDCRVDTFTVGGNGGGGKDTSNTGVRITHIASGVSGRAVDTRSQHKNKVLALERLANTPKFRTWVKVEASRLSGAPSIEEIVDRQMESQNIKIEVKDKENKWIETKFTN